MDCFCFLEMIACKSVNSVQTWQREREKNPHVKGGGKRVSSLDLSLEIQGRNIWARMVKDDTHTFLELRDTESNNAYVFSRKSGSCASLSSELTRGRLFIPPPSIAAATKRKATEFKAVPVQTQENSVFGTWLWGENVHVERTACLFKPNFNLQCSQPGWTSLAGNNIIFLLHPEMPLTFLTNKTCIIGFIFKVSDIF